MEKLDSAEHTPIGENQLDASSSSVLYMERKHAIGQVLIDVEDTNFTSVLTNKFRDSCAGPLVRGMFWGIGAAMAEYVLRKLFGTS